MANWIECFKTGTHIDSEKVEITYTLDDLNTIANLYNAAVAKDGDSAKAPLVKGHPEDHPEGGDPAYGWTEELKVEGEILMADVTPTVQFSEEVKGGMFKKVSISLYPDLTLRHIGFLGATPPAVKGLETVSFATAKNYKTYDYEQAAIAPTPAEAVAQTVETYIAEQAVRVKLFGIGVKDKIGYIQKPNAYAALTDEQFGDPVNYLYPINDLPNLLASVATWSNWDSGYSAVEKQVVMARIYTAAQALQLKIEPEYGIRLYSEGKFKNFLEIPIDKLSKNQLTDYIVGKLAKEPNNDFINNTGQNMTFEDYLKGLITALVAGVTNRVSPEEGSSVQADYDAYVAANPIPTTDAAAADPTSAPAFSEPTPPTVDPMVATLQAQIAKLELVNRTAQFSEYANQKISEGKLLPAQKNIALAALELSHNNTSVVNFSEAPGKTAKINASNAIVKLIESFPKNDLLKNFSEGRAVAEAPPALHNFSAPAGYSVNSESSAVYSEIIKFQDEQNKLGRKLNFTEATAAYSISGRM